MSFESSPLQEETKEDKLLRDATTSKQDMPEVPFQPLLTFGFSSDILGYDLVDAFFFLTLETIAHSCGHHYLKP